MWDVEIIEFFFDMVELDSKGVIHTAKEGQLVIRLSQQCNF